MRPASIRLYVIIAAALLTVDVVYCEEGVEESAAPREFLNDRTTTIQNSAISIEYKIDVRTDFAPDIVIVVRNRMDRYIGASLDWTARVCGEDIASISPGKGGVFFSQLFRRMGRIRLGTQPGGWSVAIIPLGLPVADGDPTHGREDCHSHFELKTSEGDPIEWNVPLPPAIIDEEFQMPR